MNPIVFLGNSVIDRVGCEGAAGCQTSANRRGRRISSKAPKDRFAHRCPKTQVRNANIKLTTNRKKEVHRWRRHTASSISSSIGRFYAKESGTCCVQTLLYVAKAGQCIWASARLSRYLMLIGHFLHNGAQNCKTEPNGIKWEIGCNRKNWKTGKLICNVRLSIAL